MPRVSTSRVRAIAVALFLPFAMVLAACESQPPTTAPEAPTASEARLSPGTTVLTADGFVVHELGDSDAQAVDDYWTDERMRSAIPVELARAPGRAPGPALRAPAARRFGGIDLGPWSATRYVSDNMHRRHPNVSVGKVFFTLNGFDLVCSASAVTTANLPDGGNRSVVLTAGHCVNNGFGGFATSWIFVPGFNGDEATRGKREPVGRWVATTLFTTNEWNSGFGAALGRDYGVAKVIKPGRDRLLHDVVDPLHIDLAGVSIHTAGHLASFGYGVLNWGGLRQVGSYSKIVRVDPNFGPTPWGIDSEHTGGASGGPWIFRYAPLVNGGPVNIVIGVNSYVYGGIDIIYSPIMDDLIRGLVEFSLTH